MAVRRPAWRHPAIVILFVTGCFHIFRGAPIDGVAFLAVTSALVIAEAVAPAEVIGAQPAPRTSPERHRSYAAVAVVALLVAALPRYGVSTALLICLLGLVALADAATRPEFEQPRRGSRVWPYAVIGVGAALNELAAYLMQTYAGADADRFPALSDILNPVVGWAPTRALLVGLWLAGGVGLLHLMPGRRAAVAMEGREQW